MTAALARRNAGPARHVYDAIVIGGQLGGIITAALLARRGLQVLFIDHDTGAAPYQHAEYKLPHAPFIVPAIRHISVFDEILEQLGLMSAVQRMVHPVAMQLLTKHARIDLVSNPEARKKELTRALGEDDGDRFEATWKQMARVANSTDQFFGTKPDLPPEGFFARWKFRRSLPRFLSAIEEPSPVTDATLLEFAPFLTGVEKPAGLSLSRVLGKTLAAPHVVTGGREGLHHVFSERARELGVDVLSQGDTIAGLSFDGSKPVGIRLSRNDTIYRASFIVAGCDVATLAALVPEARRKPLEKSMAALESRRAVFTMNVVVPERALPRGLGSLALVDSPDGELGGLLLQVTSADSPEHRVVSVSAKVPLALRAGGEPAVKALMQRLWVAVDDVLPFTRAHALLESSSWMDAPRVVAGAFEPLPLLPAVENSVLGVSALTLSSPYRHVLFANRQVLPGLGFEGEVLTALRAVRHIERVLHKSDPLKHRRPAA